MEERHEIINFSNIVPIKIFMHKLGSVPKHWHQSLELLYVLSGSVQLVVGDRSFTLEEEDLFLINSNSVHELQAGGCVLVALQINLSKFGLPQEQLNDLYFDLSTKTGDNHQGFLALKRIIANLIQDSHILDEAASFHIKSLAYALLSELIQHFKVEKNSRDITSQKHLTRLSRIMNYINDHYREQLSLTRIAEEEYLSVPYLSAFFEKYMGVNFTAYYNDVRLSHAVNELISSDNSVEEIAQKHGFSDSRSFVRAFKKKYSMLPSQYRKQLPSGSMLSSGSPLSASDHLVNYLEFDQHNYLHQIAKYLDKPENSSGLLQRSNRYLQAEEIDCSSPGKALTHTFKTFTSVGRAKELLLADVQEMLRTLQREVGYEYIKFHGLLSDDMLVCSVDENGKWHFNFVYVDKVMDFLLSIGLKPLIQLSFMPESLASQPGKTVFASRFNTSPPKDIKLWNRLVTELVTHLQQRYGRTRVSEWLFCVWNEPDTSSQMFGFGDDSLFYELYLNTYHSVKACDSTLRFGTPSLLMTSDYSIGWARDFIRWTRKHECVPEFLNLHFYADNFDNFDLHTKQFTTYTGKLSEDAHRFHAFIDRVKEVAAEEGMDTLPIYMTEWNLTVSHRNLINDTCFKSCYLAKNLLENYDRLDSFGYWVLTDLIEETQHRSEIFHGGLGLFTYNGIKKPHYYVFQFINRLGSQLLAQGNGYFVTRSGPSIRIMLYNYEHYNKLFASGELFNMTAINRYTPFPSHSSLEMSIPLKNLPEGRCVIKEYVINRKSGSSFDKWMEFGAMPLHSAEDLDLLSRSSAPALKIREAEVAGGELMYTATLELLEVRYVEILLES
ncbi:GH39 family glycosyl hydrolase [Paenibacillus tepidiphilus]|uniref:GH39 family glycosyl hydrolase n=1 Tax=Paenibacillus tepidiphilus TaxID=2608683 RepID=UPI00123C21D8|nr:helix-turn-helix domain-containing protein [Paenibacillus tepidiphilus]